ncbi:hypothetical protein LWI28_022460 [Acer negundo]|uniref:Retrovirus-related Pol polyprotein from transposon TNT 1-94-like beta-barrel domain-containing protein n=1 Tax=Acer negundo TaxID=4023 RepID=A0AAD5IBC8_ACENE|nr:hypothetical protein LWI28_022460 [Acer negundo]
MDSGATNHITYDLNNLSMKNRYRGNGKLIVCNGEQLSISDTGYTLVKAHTPPYQLQLRNILHVPQIAKNLLSVSKLTYDNKAFAEFYANECVVKDLKTKRVLLRGALKDGLYRMNLVETPQAGYFDYAKGYVSCPMSSSFGSNCANKTGFGRMCVFSFAQAAVATQAGASVILIFVGHLRDWARNHSGDPEIEAALKRGEDPGLALGKYTLDLFKKTNMTDAKTCDTPIAA